MNSSRCRCLLISDFNIRNLAGYLENEDEPPRIDAVVAPYGPVLPLLVDPTIECWREEPDCAVVWTRPESAVPAFNDLLAFRPVTTQTLIRQVDEFAAALLAAAERVPSVLMPSWVVSPANRGCGLLDMKPGRGIADALLRMNLRLCEDLEKAPNVFLLDARRWLNVAGKNAFSPKLWFMGKIPFASEVFAEAAHDIKAGLQALRGETRKLIIVDLDDTLWGGVVGDAGWENLRLGGHDHVGEAFADFQRALKALTNVGIVLGLVSKNDEATAFEAIANHPEMQLRRGDFAGWRINWEDKPKNILELTAELRLGLQSVVFIDDSPFERARVRQALPEVLVPEWPADPLLYTTALQGLRCFDAPGISAEDPRRTAMYLAERAREERRQVGDLDEWLRSLKIVVRGEELSDTNLPRTVQLLNKTNQMNLTTRRLTQAELNAWAAVKGNRVWTFRVCDRFGDSGLTGIASLVIDGPQATIADFVLSCRVMGRRVEETMLAWLVRYARSVGVQKLGTTYVPTGKNKPCLEFWQRSGFAVEDGVHFACDTSVEYPMPETVQFISPLPNTVHLVSPLPQGVELLS